MALDALSRPHPV